MEGFTALGGVLSIRDNKFIGVGLRLEMRHTTFQRKRSFNVILMSNIVPDDNFRSCMCGKDLVIRSATECSLILAILEQCGLR